MIPFIVRHPAIALIGLFTLALPGIGRGQATIDPVQKYTVTPNPTGAGKVFTLVLNGGSFPCGTVFSRQSVTVSANRIDLNFEADAPVLMQAPGAIAPVCPDDMATVPTFSMPALKAGTYEVWATQVLACEFTQPACMIRVAPEYAGTLKVTEGLNPYTYYVSPNPVEAGKPFALSVLNGMFTCADTFDNLTSSVDGKNIAVGFRYQSDPGVRCATPVTDLGPAFKMPALKAGAYVVKITAVPYCAPGSIDCGFILTTFYDTLIVKDPSPRTGWFLKDHEVAANLAFPMQLLNNAYGNCQTSFSHVSQTVNANAINVSFVLENHPERQCLVDIHPYGPTVDMPALKAGSYPVYVSSLPPCLFTSPACEIDIMPVLLPSDTLIVSKTAAVLMSALRAGGLTASFEGARVEFDLPRLGGKTGAWQAELLSLTGERLVSGTVSGDASTRAHLELASRPGPGIYLLRLKGADGETRLLPVVNR